MACEMQTCHVDLMSEVMQLRVIFLRYLCRDRDCKGDRCLDLPQSCGSRYEGMHSQHVSGVVSDFHAVWAS